MVTVFVSLFELIEAAHRVHTAPGRLTAVSFSMRQQKLDKLCRGYKTLRPRLTKYCRGRVPGGVDAYVCSTSIYRATVVARLTYAASAWRGFTKASDLQRINSVIDRAIFVKFH